MKCWNVLRCKIADLLILTISATTVIAFLRLGGVAVLFLGLSMCGIFTGAATSELAEARTRSAVWCLATAVAIIVSWFVLETFRAINIEKVTGQPVFEDGLFVEVFIAFPGLILIYGSLAMAFGFFAGWLGFKLREQSS